MTSWRRAFGTKTVAWDSVIGFSIMSMTALIAFERILSYMRGCTKTIDVPLCIDFRTSFSDTKAEILLQIAEGDLVATRWQLTATHTGDFLGRAPSGKQASWTGVHTDRFAGGKIAESWVDWDKYRFLEGTKGVRLLKNDK